jgi:hypothetical protein
LVQDFYQTVFVQIEKHFSFQNITTLQMMMGMVMAHDGVVVVTVVVLLMLVW